MKILTIDPSTFPSNRCLVTSMSTFFKFSSVFIPNDNSLSGSRCLTGDLEIKFKWSSLSVVLASSFFSLFWIPLASFLNNILKLIWLWLCNAVSFLHSQTWVFIYTQYLLLTNVPLYICSICWEFLFLLFFLSTEPLIVFCLSSPFLIDFCFLNLENCLFYQICIFIIRVWIIFVAITWGLYRPFMLELFNTGKKIIKFVKLFSFL